MNEIQEEIAQAEPALAQAVDSVTTIKRKDLSEIKNTPSPHPLLKFTLENMLLLLGES